VIRSDIPPGLPDSSTIEQTALADRPEIESLRQQQLGARATTSLTKEFWLPDISFGVSRDYLQPGPALFTTGISLPLPTFYWQHAKGDIAQASHFEKELDATYRDARAQVVQDVRTAYANAQHRDATGHVHSRRARTSGARGLPRCVDQLQPRRLVGARGTHRSEARCFRH
jgi:outer membrane protein TolC